MTKVGQAINDGTRFLAELVADRSEVRKYQGYIQATLFSGAALTAVYVVTKAALAALGSVVLAGACLYVSYEVAQQLKGNDAPKDPLTSRVRELANQFYDAVTPIRSSWDRFVAAWH